MRQYDVQARQWRHCEEQSPELGPILLSEQRPRSGNVNFRHGQ